MPVLVFLFAKLLPPEYQRHGMTPADIWTFDGWVFLEQCLRLTFFKTNQKIFELCVFYLQDLCYPKDAFMLMFQLPVRGIPS